VAAGQPPNIVEIKREKERKCLKWQKKDARETRRHSGAKSKSPLSGAGNEFKQKGVVQQQCGP
jgi:hypothetical protein